MPGGLDQEALSLVFKSRPDIIAGIKDAADSPARVKLFNNITKYVHDQLSNGPPDEPSAKRRKVDGGSASLVVGENSRGSNGHTNGANAASEQVQLEIKEISLSIPQRKKFDLCFTKSHLYARAPGTTGPVEGIIYAWADIEHAFYLPVPEKTQPQHNYVLFPRATALAHATKNATPPTVEPLVFTIPATAPKAGTVAGTQAAQASAVSDTYSSLFHWALGNHLRAAGNKIPIVASDPKVFHSAQRGDGRGQPVHVRAFRGSKDGYLFFLPTGILWGFKKPLLFMPLDRVVATSYTSVLQRTFNIVVEVDLSGLGVPEGSESEEIEFGMLDQEDFGNIDESYIKRHRLQDRSMVDTRKAKRELAENGKVKKEGGVDVEDDGLTDIQRAEQQLQDEEDEEEEDYDPDAEEEDDGEGSSDDEDGEGGDDDEEEFDEDEDDE